MPYAEREVVTTVARRWAAPIEHSVSVRRLPIVASPESRAATGARFARWWLGLLGLLLAGMIAHAVFGLGGHGADALFVKWIYNIVLVGSAGSYTQKLWMRMKNKAAYLPG